VQDDYPERSAMPLVERRGSERLKVIQIAPMQRFLVASLKAQGSQPGNASPGFSIPTHPKVSTDTIVQSLQLRVPAGIMHTRMQPGLEHRCRAGYIPRVVKLQS
jgi:hypothetical protein